jgi:hypothetical protein
MVATLCDCDCSVGFDIVRECDIDGYDTPGAGRSVRKRSSMGGEEMLRGAMTGSSEAATVGSQNIVDWVEVRTVNSSVVDFSMQDACKCCV